MNLFGKIAVDQRIEETVNMNTQTDGVTKGFSLKSAAVRRYYLKSESRSSYLRVLRNMVRKESSKLSHTDLQLPRIRKDEVDIKAFVHLMENNWIDPFNHEKTELVNISTGILANTDVLMIFSSSTPSERKHTKHSGLIAWKMNNRP